MVATVQKNTTGPLGQIDYRATVEDGVLDAIAIELPAGWLGPFEIAPPSPLETITTAGDMRRLIVRPKAAVEGDFHFTLRGPIDFVAAEPIVSPTSIVAGSEQCASFFVLPTGWGNERLRWNTRGMQADQLPDGMMRSDTPASVTHVYRVNGADAAAWPTILPSDSASIASTAEVHWLFSSIGENRGIAAFYLGKHRATRVSIARSRQFAVLELRVDGRPRTPPPDGKGWKIDLTPQDERQTIEVVFETRAALEATKRDVELTAPSLDGVEFDQTRWIVYVPALADPPQLIAAGNLMPLNMTDHDSEPVLNKLAQAAFGTFPAQQFVFAGTAAMVKLRFPSQSPSPVTLRWLAASIVAIGALILSRRTSATVSAPASWRWAVLGAVVGLLALAWLQPAWPGVVILLASVGIVVWPRLRDVGVGNSQDASGSPAG